MTGSGPDRPAPRVEGVTEISDEVAELLANALTHDGTPLNIFGVLAHHPKLLKRFNLMGGFLLNKGLVPAREREIVILRVGWNARSVYEFGQHTVIGRDVGLADTEIAAIAGAPHDWSADDQALIDLADDLCARDAVSEATWAALRPRWSDAELVELVVCAGFYRLVSGFLNTFGVELDDGVPGWPT
ncbi:MAG: carboxymuconolactone decarboxylase family protein [Actinomycetota bacterium]